MARLGHAGCCTRLGKCYFSGQGTEVNLAKAFNWFKKAAEMRDTRGIHLCADGYLSGKGVDQSDEQAIYCYEKFLELDDNEDARTNLEMLRGQLWFVLRAPANVSSPTNCMKKKSFSF